MSNWQRIIQLPKFSKIRRLYDEKLPLEVRIVCAEWIEERIFGDKYIGDIDSPQYKQNAVEFIESLIQQLEKAEQEIGPEEVALKWRCNAYIPIY